MPQGLGPQPGVLGLLAQQAWGFFGIPETGLGAQGSEGAPPLPPLVGGPSGPQLTIGVVLSIKYPASPPQLSPTPFVLGIETSEFPGVPHALLLSLLEPEHDAIKESAPEDAQAE